MKRLVLVLMVAAAMAVAPKAEASLFVTLTSGSSSLSCDNGTAAGVTACTTNGFVTALNDNSISFGSSSFSFAGYSFSGGSGVSANAPGNGFLAFVADSKLTLTNVSATAGLTVDFGGYNFTAPPGPNLLLTASHSANITFVQTGSTSAFTAWARDDNGTSTAGATSTLTGPGCNTGFTISTACAQSYGTTPFVRLPGPFSILGREVITLNNVGDVGSFQGTATVQNNPIPEPATMLLFGTGLAGIAAMARRRRRA